MKIYVSSRFNESQRRELADEEYHRRCANELGDQPFHGPAVWAEMDQIARIRREVDEKYGLHVEPAIESKSEDVQ